MNLKCGYTVVYDLKEKTHYFQFQDGRDKIEAEHNIFVEEVLKVIMSYWHYLEHPGEKSTCLSTNVIDVSALQDLFIDVKTAITDCLTTNEQAMFISFHAYEHTLKSLAERFSIKYDTMKPLMESYLLSIGRYLYLEKNWNQDNLKQAFH